MSIPVACPACKAKAQAPDAAAGRSVSCPKCRTKITVPAATAQRPPASSSRSRSEPVPTEPASRQATAEPPPEPTISCPFCAEPVRPQAKKCKHCGELLDPTLRAADQAARAPREPAASARRPVYEDDHVRPARAPRERSRASLFSCGGCLTLPLALVALAVVGFLIFQDQQQKAIDEGITLWDAGKRDEAVEKYKFGFGAAGKERPAILKRIVEHELTRGNTQEAEKWVKRGVTDKLDVTYDSAAAKGMVVKAMDERAEKESKAQAAAAERAKQRQESADQRKQEGDKRSKKYMRDEFRQLVTGRDKEGVLDLLGKPSSTTQSDGVEIWDYLGRSTDPVTKKTDQMAAVHFMGERVVDVIFVRLP